MPTYYYQKKKTGKSVYGGTYYMFTVWKMRKSGLKKLGETKINTASYRGDIGTVKWLISKKEGYRMDGLNFKRKDIKIRQL